MGVDVLLELASSMVPDRVALGSRSDGITFEGLAARASGGAGLLQAEGGRSVAFVGVNGPQFNVAVFASALAGLPITPLNYRLPDADLNALIDRLDDPIVLVDDDMRERVGARLPPPFHHRLARCDRVRAPDRPPGAGRRRHRRGAVHQRHHL